MPQQQMRNINFLWHSLCQSILQIQSYPFHYIHILIMHLHLNQFSIHLSISRGVWCLVHSRNMFSLLNSFFYSLLNSPLQKTVTCTCKITYNVGMHCAQCAVCTRAAADFEYKLICGYRFVYAENVSCNWNENKNTNFISFSYKFTCESDNFLIEEMEFCGVEMYVPCAAMQTL